MLADDLAPRVVRRLDHGHHRMVARRKSWNHYRGLPERRRDRNRGVLREEVGDREHAVTINNRRREPTT